MTEIEERVARAIAEHEWGAKISNREWSEHRGSFDGERIFGLARAAIVATSEWQPIETAPEDGTPILAWSDEGVSYVCWGLNGIWTFFQNHRGDKFHFRPTHWMPLPTPPAPIPHHGEKP